MLVVPRSDRPRIPDPTLVQWIRIVHPTTTWTLSVGTGCSHLAADGALDRAAAATHRTSAQRLTDAGVTHSDERVARAEKVLTSAGATAGIDLALTLLGLSHCPAVAKTVQLTLEYDPRPPYDAGTPAKARADIGELVRSHYAQRCP